MKLAQVFDLGNTILPVSLEFDDLTAQPLTRKDLADDLTAVNSSIEIIQKTRGGSWPSGNLSEDEDYLDLAWHEREFRDKSSLAYVVYNKNQQYVGCFYLYPIGVRTELTSDTEKFDVDASWWVSADKYNSGYYEKLFLALDSWLKSDFPFNNIYFSNKIVPVLN